MTEIDSDYSGDEFVPQSADKKEETSYEEDFNEEVVLSDMPSEILSAVASRKTAEMSNITKIDQSVAEQFAMVEIAQAKDIFSSEAVTTELTKSRKVNDLTEPYFQQAETGQPPESFNDESSADEKQPANTVPPKNNNILRSKWAQMQKQNISF